MNSNCVLCRSAMALVLAGGLGLVAWFAFRDDAAPVVAQDTKLAAPKGEEPALVKGKSDLTMFGGSNSRNMVNLIDTDIPGKFELESATKWKSKLGSKAYGGPIVSGGYVLAGTNNENPRNPRDRLKNASGKEIPVDLGVIMCFKESDGAFVWQAVHDKLESGVVNDWPREGVCSTPTVDGDRAYYVTNRCTVVCLNIRGLGDKKEVLQGRKYKDKTDADIIWEYDMIKELNVFPHNMSNSCPLIVDDFLFTVTSNGVDENHINVPSPEAPSFICLSKKSGKLLWKSSLPGKNIMHGQWSNPTYAVVNKRPMVIFPGGDGWLYAFKPDTGDLLWKFDANPKDAKYDLGGKGTKSDFIATAVVYDNRIYIGTGQDPEHFEGVGHFWCIDPTKSGDVSPELVTDASTDPPKTKPNPNSAVVWHHGGKETHKFANRSYSFGRTMSTAAIVDDVCYITELAGYLHVLDAKTGKKYWQYDMKAALWGSPYYVDGKVFIGTEDGDLFVFKHDKKPEVLDEIAEAAKIADEDEADMVRRKFIEEVQKKYLIAKIPVDEPIRSTPIVANGTLYILTERSLIAVKAQK